jgi:hypothetical protein
VSENLPNKNQEPAKKSKWGIGIAVVYSVFVLAMISVVIASRFNQVDLVAKDYYDREVKYQKQIERKGAASTDSTKVEVSFESTLRRFILRFPTHYGKESIQGKITLFRPSSASLDRTIAIAVDEDCTQQIDATKLPKGLWKVQVSWQVDNQEFYSEESIYID